MEENDALLQQCQRSEADARTKAGELEAVERRLGALQVELALHRAAAERLLEGEKAQKRSAKNSPSSEEGGENNIADDVYPPEQICSGGKSTGKHFGKNAAVGKTDNAVENAGKFGKCLGRESPSTTLEASQETSSHSHSHSSALAGGSSASAPAGTAAPSPTAEVPVEELAEKNALLEAQNALLDKLRAENGRLTEAVAGFGEREKELAVEKEELAVEKELVEKEVLALKQQLAEAEVKFFVFITLTLEGQDLNLKF